jgi:hypothetical protein
VLSFRVGKTLGLQRHRERSYVMNYVLGYNSALLPTAIFHRYRIAQMAVTRTHAAIDQLQDFIGGWPAFPSCLFQLPQNIRMLPYSAGRRARPVTRRASYCAGKTTIN